jgi:protein ImuB
MKQVKTRIACVTVPRFSIEAYRRSDPALRNAPLYIVSGISQNARVIEISDEAYELGVRLGMTASQAQVIVPSGIGRPLDPQLSAHARAALLDAALGFGTRVELSKDRVFCEVGDLSLLHQDEKGVAVALRQQVAAVGLSARVGVAASKGVARMAALFGASGIEVVPAGQERSYVGALPVAALEPSPEAAAALQRWGLRTCAALAQLSIAEVGLRLGDEGVRLCRLASGICDDPLVAEAPRTTIEEEIELDFELDDLEALAFVLRSLCERLLEQIGVRHLAAGRVGLDLHLVDGGHDVRELALSAPTRDPNALSQLLRLSVEKRPPNGPISGVRLFAEAAHFRTAQLDFFTPAGPPPERLSNTIARLAALLGPERVGSIRPVNSHREEAFTVVPFSLSSESVARKKREGVSQRVHEPEIESGGTSSSSLRLLFRHFRPARPIEVLVDSERRPQALSGDGLSVQVLVAAGPYLCSGEWWMEGGFSTDVFEVHASDGALYRIHRNSSGHWFLDGYYD